MAKRSVTTEVQIAALSAAIELVARPEYSRDWLKEEFADEKINSVRVTGDILDAVEVTMVNKLEQIAKNLQAELDELLAADSDEDESASDN